jgi:hypothetical protein
MRRKFLLFFVLLPLLFTAGCTGTDTERVRTVQTQIQNLLSLHTFEYIYRDVVYLGKEKSFLFFKTMDKRLLFSIDIRVQAGINLQKGFEIITERGNRSALYLKLPAPEILLIDAREDTINQYFLKEYGGTISRLEFSDEIDAVKARIAEDARTRGILDQARRNAEDILENILALSGFTEITFLYPEKEEKETEDEEIQG